MNLCGANWMDRMFIYANLDEDDGGAEEDDPPEPRRCHSLLHSRRHLALTLSSVRDLKSEGSKSSSSPKPYDDVQRSDRPAKTRGPAQAQEPIG